VAVSTRERLLSTALGVFAERGTDGGSMREIARRAGVNVATAYHHFGSKRAMFLAIFKELGFLDPPFDLSGLSFEGQSPEQRLELILLGSWMFMSTGADVVRLAVLEAMKGDDEVRAVFHEWRKQGDARIEEMLVRAGLATKANAPRRAWVVRQVIWATFVEALMYDRFDTGELREKAETASAALMQGNW
jgi:AcrR family transcriptional regulator